MNPAQGKQIRNSIATHGGDGDGLLHTALTLSYAAALYLAKNL